MKKITYTFSTIAILAMSPSLALACTTQRTPHFENDKVKVWTSHICPKEELPFHAHQNPRVLISASDGEIDVQYKDGRKSKILLKKNVPLYVDAKQGSMSHNDLNIGKEPMDITVIELKTATQ